nr:hypothetical protein [uncultured bacterium]
MQEIFKTILTAIAGGLALYYLPKLIRFLYLKLNPILVYQFDDDGTDLGAILGARRIHHSFGKALTDNKASNHNAWEHTADRKNNGHSTCYGPYTKEIPFRGKYKARFRLKAIGVKNKTDPILVLDVAYGQKIENGKYVTLGTPLVEKEIRGKDLIRGEYQEFDVKFDYDGQSLIEFRCTVLDPENYKKNVSRILFDNVKVFQISELI